jgi:hypothetical protein
VKTVLEGKETVTLELEGDCHLGPQLLALPDALTLVRDDEGFVPFSILLFAMQDLRLNAPLSPGASYHEALWRLHARVDDEDAWLVWRCDVDQGAVHTMAKMILRYPAHHSPFDFEDGDEETRVRVRAGDGVFGLRAVASDEEARQAPPRPTYCISKGKLFRVPWDEVPAPFGRVCSLAVEQASLASHTLGTMRLSPRGRLLRGRTHRCGLACAHPR